MISAKFCDGHRFCDHYKRNNKAKGRKNLRCFPDCRTTGHVKTGYCGRPVVCEVAYDCGAAANLELMAFCEFRPSGDSETPCGGVALGNTFAFPDIIERSRGTGHNPGDKALHPWFPGSVLKSSVNTDASKVETAFSFNKGNQGWHYAWQSHRMTRATKHELHIFILAGTKGSIMFTCVCELSSPAFDIHCRRKRTSPTKAATCLLNFQAQANPALAGVKRSASEITCAPGERSASPERQLAKRVEHIMPSNTVATSPGVVYRSLQSRKVTTVAQPSAFPVWQSVSKQMSAFQQPPQCSDSDIMLQIQELEARKQFLTMQQIQTAGDMHLTTPEFAMPASTSSPNSAGHTPITKNQSSTELSTAKKSSPTDALALLAMCC
jgi:hypothetical protein